MFVIITKSGFRTSWMKSRESRKELGSSVLDKWSGLLPFDVWAMKSEIEGWRDYPTSYSYSVLSSILVK
uniref:Uncharacterized protein n=1 Tax=Brassica oleracea TaxID=3712 RepID=A0A3P6FSD0_BRAOL|nr:unnamed protein product [Brassica oleracea]